ncbi:MAG: hypothetical protein K8R58_03955, partial [Bacteroidales bacterium]|nr:hypothetical protein [Bacteroidales bacterium]
MDECERIYEYLKNKNFSQVLNLTEYDPVDFIKKFNELYYTIIRFQLNFEQHLESLKHININRQAYDLLISDYIESVSGYFNQSECVEYLFAPLLYNFAKIDYNNSYINKYSKIIDQITDKLNFNCNSKRIYNKIAKSVYDSYLLKAENYIAREKFNEANDLLSNAKCLCSGINVIECTDKLSIYISRSKYGIFNSYLNVAKRAIEVNNFDMAENYIEHAKLFQKVNKQFIITDIKINKMYDKLFDLCIIKGEEQNISNNFDMALTYYNKANNLCISKPSLDCNNAIKRGISRSKTGTYRELLSRADKYLNNDDIDKAEELVNDAIAFQKENNSEISPSYDVEIIISKIKYRTYLDFIKKGKQFLNFGIYQYAFEKFSAAKEMENKFNFEKDENLDYFISKAVKPILLKNIKKGKFKIWANELDSANIIYQRAIDSQIKYALTNDNEVKKAIGDLKSKIFSKECQTLQVEYKRNYIKAKQHIKSKNYIIADGLLAKALQISNENTLCNIADSSVSKTKQKYIPAATYQQLFLEAEQALYENDFELFFRKYEASERCFNDFEICNKELTHITMFNYICSQSKTELLTYAVDFYEKNKNYNNALELLKLLHERNYPIIDAKILQENLGLQMGITDYKKSSSTDP